MIRHAWSTLALLAMAVLPGACTPAPAAIGGPCELGVPVDDGHSATLAAPALECAGRVCVQVGETPSMCSAECSGQDDCDEVNPAGAGLCRKGFTCAVVGGAGTYACRRLCVCRDAALPAISCAAPR